MNTPGDLLRKAREEKGLTLSQAAAMTRISRTMLKHLEQNRFEEFNAEVFVRGHLRNYAREVGADPERIVQAYERLNGRSASNERKLSARSSRSAPARKPRAAARPKKKAKVNSTKSKRETRRRRTSVADWTSKIGPTHMVAVLLVIVGLVLFVSLLSGNRATAQDPAEFPTKSQDDWELERDVEQTRWLLEQPATTE